MSTIPASPASLRPDSVHLWGERALQLILTVGLVFILLLAWRAPNLLIVLPAVLLAGPFVLWLFSRPMYNFIVALIGYAAITDFEPGLQLPEVLYGLYFLAYMGHWFVTRLFVYKEPLITGREDLAVLGMIFLVSLWTPIALLFGATPQGVFSEWSAYIFLAFYFPVKETITRYRRGAEIVLVGLGIICMYIAIRNMFNYQAILLSATEAWQIAKSRVPTNDDILTVASLLGTLLIVFAETWRQRLVSFVFFGLVFTGLILTQSRGYWVAYLLGVSFLFILLPSQLRKRMFWLGAVSGAAGLGVGILLFNEATVLIIGGLLDRLFTLGSAASTDLSLINRFRETAAVWSHIVQNPILGHGMGVTYEFFDLAHMSTDIDTFVHNGYVGLWYKYGIVGLGLMLYIWFHMIARGIQAYRASTAPFALRFGGVHAAIALVAFTLSANTSNPFFLNDTLFLLGTLFGLARGTYVVSRAGGAVVTQD